MRLRRLLAALVAALSLTGLLAGPAFAAKKFVDGNGSCSDLRGAGANLVDADGDLLYDAAAAEASLATDPCRKGSYVFTVYDAAGNEIVSSTSPTPTSDGLGGTTLNWFVQLDPQRSDTFLCATIQSLDMRGNLIDNAAPDSDDPACAVGTSISGPPAGTWH